MTDEELVKALRDFADDGYADLAADRIEALTEQLEAARADAEEAEAYAEELARDLVKADNDINDRDAKLAKAVEALREIAGECGCSTARAIIAEIEGSDAP